MPYDRNSERTIYHTREFSIRRLSLLPKPQIFMSHDWPVDITSFGTSHPTPQLSLQSLLRFKPFWKNDIQNGKLGSQPSMGLLRRLKPDWWFSAHMHARWDALVIHEPDGTVSQPGVQRAAALQPEAQRNPDEIVIDEDDDDVAPAANAPAAEAEPARNPDEIVMDEEESEVAVPPEPPKAATTTKFLALDKCLPKRQFLEVIDITPPPTDSDPTIQPTTGSSPSTPTKSGRQRLTFSYDPHWLAITRAFQPYLSTGRNQIPFPATEEEAMALVEKELEWVMANVPKKLALKDGPETWELSRCQEFVHTAPPEKNPGNGKAFPRGNKQPPWYPNPQTKAFCELLEIEDKINKHQAQK